MTKRDIQSITRFGCLGTIRRLKRKIKRTFQEYAQLKADLAEERRIRKQILDDLGSQTLKK
jgi:hypothetical protein